MYERQSICKHNSIQFCNKPFCVLNRVIELNTHRMLKYTPLERTRIELKYLNH